MARFVTTTTADDKEIRVNMDNVRCLYLGRSGLTEIVFDGEHQVAVKDKMETLENAGCPSRKSYPRVAMMQSGQDWYDDDGPRSLDGSS